MELSIEELHEIAAIVQTYIMLYEERIKTSKYGGTKEFYQRKIVRAEQLRDRLVEIHVAKLIDSKK